MFTSITGSYSQGRAENCSTFYTPVTSLSVFHMERRAFDGNFVQNQSLFCCGDSLYIIIMLCFGGVIATVNDRWLERDSELTPR